MVRFQVLPKNPPNACAVAACEICGSESTVVEFYKITINVVSRENFPPFHKQIKVVEEKMDGAAIYR